MPRLRRLVLTVHLTVSIGWIGSAVAFLALAVTAVTSEDDSTVLAVCVSMDRVLVSVIVPLALAALASGLVLSLGTKWGLFRHYWVILKLVLTTTAVLVLLGQIGPMRALAEAAADGAPSVAASRELWRPLIHAVGGLVVLLVVQVLGVYKPLGPTGYGRRGG